MTEKPFIWDVGTGMRKAPKESSEAIREADEWLQERMAELREAERKAWRAAPNIFIG